MAEDEQQTPEVLQQRLAEYRASLEELNEGLKLDPSNEELVKLRKDVMEVIADTESRLRSQTTSDRTPPAAAAVPAAAQAAVIREGDKVYTLYSVDGLWYEAVVKQVQPTGSFTVTYTGYGNSEEREIDHIRRIDEGITLEQLNAQAKAGGADTKKRTSAAWELTAKDSKKQAKYAPNSSRIVFFFFFLLYLRGGQSSTLHLTFSPP